MNGFKEWLNCPENNARIPPNQFNGIIDEVNNNRIALKASGIYSITFSLVANVSNKKIFL